LEHGNIKHKLAINYPMGLGNFNLHTLVAQIVLNWSRQTGLRKIKMKEIILGEEGCFFLGSNKYKGSVLQLHVYFLLGKYFGSGERSGEKEEHPSTFPTSPFSGGKLGHIVVIPHHIY